MTNNEELQEKLKLQNKLLENKKEQEATLKQLIEKMEELERLEKGD